MVVKEQLKQRDEEPGASLTVTDVAKRRLHPSLLPSTSTHSGIAHRTKYRGWFLCPDVLSDPAFIFDCFVCSALIESVILSI